MDNYHIRAEARQLLAQLPGKLALFIIPIITTILELWIRVRQNIQNLSNSASELPLEQVLSALIFSLVIIILVGFITTGIYWIILNVYRGHQKSVSFKESLIAFSDHYFGRTLATLFMKGLFLFLWLLLCLACFFIFNDIIFGHILYRLFYENGQLLGVIFLALIFALFFLIPYFVKIFSYGMIPFILFDRIKNQTYTTATEVITESRQLMDGYKLKLFLLELSFIGWWFLVGLTFGLAAFYVVPYNITARAIFYEKLKALRDSSI